MRSVLYMPLEVEAALEEISRFLRDEGFIFSEEEATFKVLYRNGKPEKVKDWSRFWSRKNQLGSKYPAHYSLVIKGSIKTAETGSVVELELIEYHASRPHSYGGTASVFEYFERFVNNFAERVKPSG